VGTVWRCSGPLFGILRARDQGVPRVGHPSGGDVILAVTSTGDAVAVGYIVGFEPEVCEFKRVYVPPEHRRRGIAAQLATAMVARARDLG
jgi:predicted GNAT family acetyltransferase